MDDETKNLLSSIQQTIKIKGREYYPHERISQAGRKSVVWKGSDEYGAPVAIKIATYEDYIEHSFLEEASRAAKLRNYNEFTRFGCADIWEYKGIKFVCFIEDYVEGYTLKQYIKKFEITPSFIINYVSKICNAINILKELELRHNDLHFGNVMIVKPPKGSLSEEYTVKIIDMGSLKKYEEPIQEEKYNDHEWFTVHLMILINSMLLDSNQRRRPLSLEERKFRAGIIPLLKSMLEEDPQMALLEPSRILSLFKNKYSTAKYPHKESELKLEDPFDYISAEHIASDKLLVNLFAESCPWIGKVTGPNPVLLTGPRGCGKSMLFRRLSLKALLCLKPEEIRNSNVIGFYLSCSADLRNHFGIKLPFCPFF